MNADARQPQLVLEFQDNRLLPALYGEHDRNLARIEQKLGVSMVSRGNRVSIQGEEGAAATAGAALNELYRRLQRGQSPGLGDVDGAVRMASAADASGGAGDGKGEGEAIRTQKRTIWARSPLQADYVRALREHPLVVALGPAGTGKTYIAVAVAVSMLREGRVDRIILTRPAVEAGERLGFLPGTLEEKVDPYMRPMLDALFDMMPGETVIKRREEGIIEVAPLAYMRGRTLANAFIVLDEAQNTTPIQMKMILTRMGENAHMVVTGDPSQVDLPLGTKSGLVDAMEILRGIDDVGVIEFSHVDVVRHALVTRIVKAYGARDLDLLGDSS